MNKLLQAANDYWNLYGWITHPLGYDTNNLPKRPLTKDWTNIEASIQAIESLDWKSAKGIGLLTGSKSNIGVIDVDDKDLALVLPLLWDHYPLMVSTARDRGHVYVKETDGSSGSSKFFVTYRGREIGIELKGNGTQVAMPPTDNYQWLTCIAHHGHAQEDPLRSQPLFHNSLASAWKSIMDRINNNFGEGTIRMKESMSENSGYPKPFASHVPEGRRNEMIYREALAYKREGLLIEEAIEAMLDRVIKSYAGVMTEQEILNTIRSAYKGGYYNGSSDRNKRPVSMSNLFGQDQT